MLLFFFGFTPFFIGLKKITTSWSNPFSLYSTPTYFNSVYFWIPLISTKSYFSLFSVKNGFKKYWYVMEVLIYIKYIKKLIVKNIINILYHKSMNLSFCRFSKYFIRLIFNKFSIICFFKFFFFYKGVFLLTCKLIYL